MFPPIIQRGTPDATLLSDHMKNRVKPKRTILQYYNGSQLLLMTPTIKFYAARGYQLRNPTLFVQFARGRLLSPFCEKVVKMRVQATYEQDEAKNLTAKLYGNSGTKNQL